MQAQALRHDLFRILQNANIDSVYNSIDNPIEEDKRSISSLARGSSFPYNKRSLAALARGGYLRTPSNQDQLYQDFKRSIATLAKNGQLPNYSHPEENDEPADDEELEETKRSIEAMARNGNLHHKREQLSELLNALAYDKRNIGSVARDYNFPSYGKRFLGALARNGELRNKKDDFLNGSDEKRNIQSIVRNSKRNIQSLIRNDAMPFPLNMRLPDEYKRNIGSIARGAGTRFVMGKRETNSVFDEDKRNLASIKAQTREKRDVDEDYAENEEYSSPVYQNSNFDYDELLQALAADYPAPEKRFLGKFSPNP